MFVSRIRCKGCSEIKDVPDLSLQETGLIICDQATPYDISLIDIIYKLLGGNYETLQDILFGNLSKAKSIRQVEMVLNDGNQEHILNIETPLSCQPEQIQQASALFKRTNQILKQLPLKEFCESEPQQRFEQISRFVNLESYIDFEKRLEILTAPTDRLLARLNSQINHKKAELASNLATETCNDLEGYLSCINDLLENAESPPIKSMEELPEAIRAINDAVENWTNSKEFTAVSELKTDIEKLVPMETLFELWAQYSDTWSNLRYKELETKSVFFEEVLQKGMEWIESEHLNECPLCGSEIDIPSLKSKLNKRIQQNNELIILRGNFAQTAENFCETVKSLLVSLTVIDEKCRVAVIENPLSRLRLKLEEFSEQLSEKERDKTFFPILNNFYRENLELDFEKLSKNVAKKFEDVAADNKLIKLKDTQSRLNQAYSLYKDIERISQNREELLRQKHSDRRINDIAVSARKNIVEYLIGHVANISDKLINDIFMPANSHDKRHKNNWRFNPAKSITYYSTGLDTDRSALPEYYDHSISPVVGLCIFLAVRSLYRGLNQQFPVIMIDKALDCIEPSHIEPVAQMILSKFSAEQLFISTNNLEWVKALTNAKTAAGTKLAVKFDSLSLYSQYRKLV